MDKFVIIALIIGILIGYFISSINGHSIIKDVTINHPATWV